MKRPLFRILPCFLILLLLTGCFSYRDMNRLLFYTMGVGDLGKDEEFLFFGEAFKGYRGEGEKAGKEKRVVLFGHGKSLTEAVEQMRNSVNNPVEYAGNKSFVFSEKLARHGLSNILDLFNRDQKPSLRIYFYVLNGSGQNLVNVVMTDEHFMGLYLYELMNSQKDSIGVISNQYYEFITNLDIGSGINVLPILEITSIDRELDGSIQTAQQENSGGAESSRVENGEDSAGNEKPTHTPYIIVNGAAVFVGSTMQAALSRSELETYKLLTKKVKSGLLNAPNPDIPDKEVGYTVLDNQSKFGVKLENGRIKLSCKTDVRAVLLEAQHGISSDPETIALLRRNLEQVIVEHALALFEKMQKENIDLFNIRRKLEQEKLHPDMENFLSNTDFEIQAHVTLDGLGVLKEVYY